jgi:eukaryotic-like serine/threonine-protein kinase
MADLLKTTLNNQYFLRKFVDSGGTADVYQAWDRKRSTNMAVKVLRQDLANDSRLIRMFEEEAALQNKLTHPNIVRLYEFGKQEKILFLVMEWIDGSDLRKAINESQKPFSLDKVTSILVPICSALDFAHKENVFHCDVKPANILLHKDGRVFLSDFGIARRIYKQKPGGSGPGTPPYMAPEQFTGGKIDARTDIYGLGVVIYQMLSGGKVPFRGDSPGSPGETTRERIKWEHLNLPLAPLKTFNPNMPEAVEEVVQKALDKDPEKRYPSAITLREEFENACRSCGGETIVLPDPVRKPPPPELPQPPLSNPPTRVHGPHLFGRRGEYAGQALPLVSQSTSLGRGRTNYIRLQEQSVSRSHATIIKTRQGVFIRDEQSTLGTLINGRRIIPGKPVQLRHGDIIQVGSFQELEFRER